MAIWDNHIHLRPEHKGVEAARQFERAGGTAFLLTHAPYEDVPISVPRDYERAYAKTLRMARAVARETQVQVFVALGPYPVDLLHLERALGREGAVSVMKKGLEIAGRHVAAGEAVAIGEIGRPHFGVEPEIRQASNEVLEYGMAVARDVDAPVVLHTEDPTAETFAEFAAMADRAGLRREKVVKHHSTPLTRPTDNGGILPSILAKETLIRSAVEGGGPFFLETDYIDDPRRPGAVLGPATVPKKTAAWRRSGLLSEERAEEIHRGLPERTYGIELHAT